MYVCLNRGTTGDGLSQPDFAQLASHAGFQGADVDLSYAQQHGSAALADLYASHNLRFGGWGPALNHRVESARRAEAAKTHAAQSAIAAELKIDSCATWIMPSSDLPFMENWKLHVESLRPVAKILADHGLRFGLEFVAPFHLRRQHPHEFISTPGLMLELADSIGPNAGLLVDCIHCHCSQTPWRQVAELPAEKIVLVHLNDVPNVPVEDVQDGQRLLPGDGVLDLAGFFVALKGAGYEGPVSLEAFGCMKDLPPQVAARKAWSACRKVMG